MTRSVPKPASFVDLVSKCLEIADYIYIFIVMATDEWVNVTLGAGTYMSRWKPEEYFYPPALVHPESKIKTETPFP